VVRIEASLLDGAEMQGSGSACELEGKKYILSNRHVVTGAKEVRVGHRSEDLKLSPGFKLSPELDLAVIEVPEGLRIDAIPKRESPLRTGERVYAIGFPLGLDKSITSGLLSSESEKMLQFDAPISSGNSGGPLIDKDGFAIGVVTAGSISASDYVAQNVNFAIPISVLPELALFRDPILSFFDAWLGLVAAENSLAEGLAQHRVLDLYTLLFMELGRSMRAVLPPGERKEIDSKLVRELLKAAEARIRGNREQTIEKAALAAAGFLRSQISKLDKLPNYFVSLGNTSPLAEFKRDERPGGFFRLNVNEDEVAPLLRLSLDHVKARYEDVAWQLEFLAEVRPLLNMVDTNFVGKVLNLNESIKGWKRPQVRIDYSLMPKIPLMNA
jgi:hypothetical protein